MLSAVIQVKTAYETARASNQSAEEALGMVQSEFPNLDVTALKAALMQSSTIYRRDCGQEEEDCDHLNFSNDQLRQVNDGIFQIAMGAEDESTRLKALCYIRDDKKGRRDAIKHIAQNNQFNVLQFNNSLKEARSMADGLKEKMLKVA